MTTKTCQICGKNSGMYPLCKEHMEMKNKGLVIKDENGKWILKSEGIESCVICHKTTNIYKLYLSSFGSKEQIHCNICDECIKEYNQIHNDINKNQSQYELRDYYFNLKSSIYRIKSIEIVKSQTIKLIAIANILSHVKGDNTISSRCLEDIAEIQKNIDTKNQKIEIKSNAVKEQQDQIVVSTANIKEHRARDGHLCKSDKEVIIDDLLYNWNICHAYGLAVKEIPNEKERTIISDWFIPLNGTNGIYIEYWGKDTSDYQDNQKEKEELYTKYKLKWIGIKKDEPMDRQNLERNLYSELIKKGWKDHNR